MENKNEAQNYVIRLKRSMDSLFVIHQASAQMKHGVRSECRWVDYFPSQFIYSFCAFNTLYSIDWDESLTGGKQVPFKKKQDGWHKNNLPRYRELYETEKQEKYISFCCKDRRFIDSYKGIFAEIVTCLSNVDNITNCLEGIRIDNSNRRISPNEKKEFIHHSKMILNGQLTEASIDKVVSFLYKVRCNLFHGAKTITDIQEAGQQDRFKVYASIIVAVNQMIFSYFDYYLGGNLEANKDAILNSLLPPQ